MACVNAVNEDKRGSDCTAGVFAGHVSFGTCARCAKCTDVQYYDARIKKSNAKSWVPPPAGTVIIQKSSAIEYPRWPRILKLIASRRKPGESGLGDTIHRLIPKSDELIARLKAWGIDCGCRDRVIWLNLRYPYTTTADNRTP